MSTGPAHRVQSAVVEYGYPQGHLGHLTEQEEAALKNFKVLCATKGLYKPADGEQPSSHDDATLLRFLRARRFVVNDAFKQLEDTETWRKANQIDKLYETIDLQQYDDTRRLYPQWTGRRDRRGIPVYVFEVKHLNSKTMSAYEKTAGETISEAKSDGKTPAKLLRLFALYENLTRFVMPLCTAQTDREHPRTPITQSNNIVDISGVGLKQFWNLRTHMQDASTLATAHYPETLDRIFIIGAPSFFPTVWGWIKKWFDPITTSKIFILSASDTKSTLESFIDPANIPKKYGGQLDFEWGGLPVLDPALKEVLTFEGTRADFPAGPAFWIHGDDGQMASIAVGSENRKNRREKVCIVRTKNTEGGLATIEDSKKPVAPNGTVETKGGLLAVPGTGATAAAVAAPSEVNAIVEKNEEAQINEENVNAPVHIQNGEIVPPTRPDLNTFVTATEGLDTLKISDNDTPAVAAVEAAVPAPVTTEPLATEAPVEPQSSSRPTSSGTTNGKYNTTTAALLDPNVPAPAGAAPVQTEDAHKHHTEADNTSAVGGAAEEADHAHGHSKKESRHSLKGRLLHVVGK